VSTAPPPQPPDHSPAQNELHTLGRQLDNQVTQGTGSTDTEIDATLTQMRHVHNEIVTGAHLGT
jgi:hypothetical protein